MCSGRYLPAFRGNLLHPSSGYKKMETGFSETLYARLHGVPSQKDVFFILKAGRDLNCATVLIRVVTYAVFCRDLFICSWTSCILRQSCRCYRSYVWLPWQFWWYGDKLRDISCAVCQWEEVYLAKLTFLFLILVFLALESATLPISVQFQSFGAVLGVPCCAVATAR